MHPWHDHPVDPDTISESCPVIVEIPKGSKNKYELDKATGLLRLDRVLHSAVHYPADCGFIPRTVVSARPIGVMRMRDDKGIDDKIVAVSVSDPAFADYRHKDQLPAHVMREVRRFFEDYKALEHKRVVVDELLGPDDAVKIIREALDAYVTRDDPNRRPT